jgi:hypothetical protein
MNVKYYILWIIGVKCKTYEHDAVDYEKKICVQSRSIKYPSRPSFSNGSVFQRRRFNQPCIVPKIHIGALFRPERPRVPLGVSRIIFSIIQSKNSINKILMANALKTTLRY